MTVSLDQPRASSSSSSPRTSLHIPSLLPLSHDHPLLSPEHNPNFDVDAFLLTRLHIPLDELRGELREYLAKLKEELVQLINDDYGEFIALGTGLRGEGERLERLEKPLGELRGQVEVIRDVLLSHQTAVENKLAERAALREEKTLLNLLLHLSESLSRTEALLAAPRDGKTVSRVANEYTQLVYLVAKAKAEGCAYANEVETRIIKIKSALNNDLSALFTETLQARETLSLTECFKTYELVEGWREAEQVFRQVVQQSLSKIITPDALSPVPATPFTPTTPGNPFEITLTPPQLGDSPLAALYSRVLAYVERDCKPILDVAERFPGFEMLANVVWAEIATRIQHDLGNVVFAAGRPDELHKHYTLTHDFLQMLEDLAPSARAVVAMRAHPTYASFERRWQLPVYFQLRWKEIVGAFEESLAGGPTRGYQLGQSAAAVKAVEQCWADDVYLPELAHRFWRLTLQILSRYGRWLAAVQTPADDDAALKSLTAIVVDVRRVVRELRTFWDQPRTRSLASLEPALASLAAVEEPIANSIVTILSKRATDSLKLVRSVASQLRTAGPAEPKPSFFIPAILKPVHQYFDGVDLPDVKPEWSRRVVAEVFTNYAAILTSVRKTEDLLRKHRKGKKNTFSLFASSAPPEADEQRFRAQMLADVQALADDAATLGVDVKTVDGWTELHEVAGRESE